MNAKLLLVEGATTKSEVTLNLPAVLGRSRKADITVPHPQVSRRHCELSEHNGLLMLRDLASLNGTMIGGRRIESAPLLPNSEFTIGPLMFRVVYKYEGDVESVPETRFAAEHQTAPDGSHATPDFVTAGTGFPETPWSQEPPAIGKQDRASAAPKEIPLAVPPALPPEPIAAEKKPTILWGKEKPGAASPAGESQESDEMDPGFGKFLEGLE